MPMRGFPAREFRCLATTPHLTPSRVQFCQQAGSEAQGDPKKSPIGIICNSLQGQKSRPVFTLEYYQNGDRQADLFRRSYSPSHSILLQLSPKPLPGPRNSHSSPVRRLVLHYRRNPCTPPQNRQGRFPTPPHPLLRSTALPQRPILHRAQNMAHSIQQPQSSSACLRSCEEMDAATHHRSRAASPRDLPRKWSPGFLLRATRH